MYFTNFYDKKYFPDKISLADIGIRLFLKFHSVLNEHLKKNTIFPWVSFCLFQ